jgi:uroporphyrin-III C-methyltransferase/precorrin-2 dehydrogenase/sirohydrochlorin ferrochelatase
VSIGTVTLVGAGPGDPDLLTRRAVKRLEQADLVLYDALVDPQVLDLAPAAQRIFVGKRAGRPAVSQEFINRLLVRAARRGRTVVRLKGGDPFVFGRGGEEALALAAAGIPCEIVPGVSSAVAAPALAGIPVTHRGVASAFVVVSGHAESSYRPVLEAIPPQRITVVVLMGLAHLERIAGVLLERGWSTATPLAVLFSASREEASVWTSTLGDVQSGRQRPQDEGESAAGPGTIVIGDVVRIRGLIAASPEVRGTSDDEQLADAAQAIARRG